MFCPKCRTEYREGFSRCDDCDVDLIAELAPITQPEPKPISYVEIARFRDPALALLASGGLEADGIASRLHDNHVITLNWKYSYVVGGVKLWVAKEDAEDALTLLQSDGSAALTDGVGFPAAAEDRCPHCGGTDAVAVHATYQPAAYLLLLATLAPLPSIARWAIAWTIAFATACAGFTILFAVSATLRGLVLACRDCSQPWPRRALVSEADCGPPKTDSARTFLARWRFWLLWLLMALAAVAMLRSYVRHP